MTEFVLPSLTVRNFFCAVMLFICVIQSAALICAMPTYRKKTYIIFNLFILLIDIMFFSLMSTYQFGYILSRRLTLSAVIAAETVFTAVPIFEIIFFIVKSRRVITDSSVKSALDNLPAGILFFDSDSYAVLTNHAMLTLVRELTGGDTRMMKPLDDVLEGRTPAESAQRIGDDFRTYRFSDGRIRTFEKKVISLQSKKYVQFTANDITDIYKMKQELEHDNELLKKAAENLRTLSENVVAATREEEILNFKMQIHDDFGRSITAVRRFLMQNDNLQDAGELIDMWRRSVSLIKKDNESKSDDELIFLITSAKKMGLDIIIDGRMPKEAEPEYTVISAVRTCLINAVRHADATEMYVKIERSSNSIVVNITNNGKSPECEISEGGGLSALRRRVEKYAGIMTVTSLPAFALNIRIPVV